MELQLGNLENKVLGCVEVNLHLSAASYVPHKKNKGDLRLNGIVALMCRQIQSWFRFLEEW